LNYHEGGIIYIGIDNDGNAVGVPDIDGTQLQISNRIRDNIQPPTLGLYDVVIENYQGKDVIKIIISSGNEKPYYLRSKGMSESGCFMRTGSGVQPMPSDMITELFSKRTRNSLSKIESPRDDLTFEQLKIYYEERKLKLNDKFKQSLELLTKDKQPNYVAYLLADENATSIKVAKYSGTDKVDLIENEEYGYCSLIKATKSVLNKFEIENITKTKITSRERVEKKLVDSVALREAIINAIVHNDYSSEVPPLFEIFSDRIVITSYGGLIDGLSEEEFFGCCSKPRNRELMRVFKDVGLVEQLGSGMARILSAYDKSIFQLSKNFTKVTFKFSEKAAIKSGDKKAAIKSGDKKTSKKYEIQKAAVIEYLTINKSAKSEEFIDVLGVKITRVKTVLKRMVDDGVIATDGGNKNRTYMLK
jgi:predicted HTH transcriptional regulator